MKLPFARQKRKALVAEDDAGTLDLFSFLLKQEGWEVLEAATGEELIRKAQDESPDVLMLDQRMPDYSGTESYQILEANGVHIPAILISAFDDVQSLAARSGITHAFRKPVDVPELLDAMDEAYDEGH